MKINVKKMMVYVLGVCLVLGTWGVSQNKTFAEENTIDYEWYDVSRVIERIPISDYIYPDEDNNIQYSIGPKLLIGGYSSYKENVAHWNSVSYYPLTHEFSPGSGGGSVTVTEARTFGTTVSGTIDGLGINVSQSVTTSAGYTATIRPNGTARVVAAVYYQNERGLKVTKRYGRVLSRNIYHVKKPTSVRLFLDYLN